MPVYINHLLTVQIGRIERLENIVQEAMASGGAVIANDHGCTCLQLQHDRKSWLSRLG